jgi:Skp family chaperone for outer membrane proteins
MPNDLEWKMRSFERKRQDYEDQARKREQEALAPLEKGLSDVIEKMATEQNFSLILDLRGMLIFYNPKLEITDEVTSYFDAQP